MKKFYKTKVAAIIVTCCLILNSFGIQAQQTITIYTTIDVYTEAVDGNACYNGNNIQFGVAESPLNFYYPCFLFEMPEWLTDCNVIYATFSMNLQSGSGTIGTASAHLITAVWNASTMNSNWLNPKMPF